MKSERIKIIGRTAVLCLLLLLTASCSSTKALIVLLPDENHVHSAVAISQDDGVTVLDTPMAAARVDTRGRVEKEAITKAEVEKNFGEALVTLPPKPISFTLYF